LLRETRANGIVLQGTPGIPKPTIPLTARLNCGKP
jgi:hypothetical protein